jgi:DNA-binding protein HU-beta
MNKDELVKAVAEKTGFTQKDAKACVDAFTAVVTDALKAGDPVTLVGFGTFKVADRAERTGRNPQTKEAIIIPATKVPVFKAGAPLKAAVK